MTELTTDASLLDIAIARLNERFDYCSDMAMRFERDCEFEISHRWRIRGHECRRAITTLEGLKAKS